MNFINNKKMKVYAIFCKKQFERSLRYMSQCYKFLGGSCPRGVIVLGGSFPGG